MSAHIEPAAGQTAPKFTSFINLAENHADSAESSAHTIRLELPSTTRLVYVLHGVVSEIVRKMEFDAETGERIVLAVTEAGTNAIKHGNRGDAKKTARFEFTLSESRLTVVVRDAGAGFDRDGVPDPLHPANLLKSSGRGLYLIEACMDVVTYEASGTVIRMVKYKS